MAAKDVKSLSLRMVEEVPAFHGIVVRHETLRQWGGEFG
jgi:transposase-like protein